MERSFDLLSHFPDRWRELREVQAICETDVKSVVPPTEIKKVIPSLQPTHDEFKVYTHDELGEYSHDDLIKLITNTTDMHTIVHLWDCMDAELNSVFILPYGGKDGADDNACSRWESILGIIPYDDSDLDDRRFVIYSKMYQQIPYSYKHICKMLDDLVGKGNWVMARSVESKTLDVRISMQLLHTSRLEAVRELLENIVPANMQLFVSMDSTTYEDLTSYTYGELSAYTCEDIKIQEF